MIITLIYHVVSTHSLDPCLWGGSPIILLLVHQPATPSLQRGLSTNPGVTVWVCMWVQLKRFFKNGIYFLAALAACGCDGDVICVGHDLNRCTWGW